MREDGESVELPAATFLRRRMSFGEARGTSTRMREWLDQPLSGLYCVLAWLVATLVFVGMVALVGGPTANDANESIYSTWAVQHGDFACAYPHSVTQDMARGFFPNYAPGPHEAPLWPLFSGGVAALTRIGHSSPFPSAHELGASCISAYTSMYAWAHGNEALWPTLGIGYLSWFALLAGFVAMLRASGRGRRRWEALGVVLLALFPVEWEPILDEFHPQDLLAMGLLLVGVACAQRSRWVWAGAFLGLAVASQQFALLVLVPLFVVATGSRRWRLAGSAAAAWALVGLPFLVDGGRNALGGLIFGTGDSMSLGGTLLWETGLHGHAMLFASRILPILVSAVVAWWVRFRLDERVLGSTILLSLLATTLSLRLVFEQGLFMYKFMAFGVMLLLLSLVRRRRIAETIVWLVAVSLAWNPLPFGTAFNSRSWGHSAAVAIPLIVVAALFVLIVGNAFHRKIRWYVIAGFCFVLFGCVQWPPWALVVPDPQPNWLLQLILLPTGIALAFEPMISALRAKSMPSSKVSLSSAPVGATA